MLETIVGSLGLGRFEWRGGRSGVRRRRGGVWRFGECIWSRDLVCSCRRRRGRRASNVEEDENDVSTRVRGRTTEGMSSLSSPSRRKKRAPWKRRTNGGRRRSAWRIDDDRNVIDHGSCRSSLALQRARRRGSAVSHYLRWTDVILIGLGFVGSFRTVGTRRTRGQRKHEKSDTRTEDAREMIGRARGVLRPTCPRTCPIEFLPAYLEHSFLRGQRLTL